MLLLIPVNRYNKIAIRRKAASYINRMSLVPLEVKEKESIAIEVINYEHLWPILMNLVETPKRISRKMMEQIEHLSI